jgi:UDP-N-acetylmuramoyl-L-alanyl-D-glutamate--2,6-diaminopimelate ligase
MHRVWGIEYDVAVLTNITQDHLDLHKTMEDYVNTKLSLFSKLITNKRKP